MSTIGRIKGMLRRERRDELYADKNRLISPRIYHALKALRRCQNCHEKINYPPGIHHKKPVRNGGSNEEDNLLACCRKCHDLLDEENEKKYGAPP